ncbi:hypothetical protein AVEN_59702-1 [Araneus ventricosus]|uniref:Uncharacterized protein n=1 Tax=Araneus ventricosus TaxID=182803 RepID=A0A4Y2BMT2_ARAVE|nr:hypothetical protein AVEN_59702-1 [Araneus ventricosus]
MVAYAIFSRGTQFDTCQQLINADLKAFINFDIRDIHALVSSMPNRVPSKIAPLPGEHRVEVGYSRSPPANPPNIAAPIGFPLGLHSDGKHSKIFHDGVQPLGSDGTIHYPGGDTSIEATSSH